jgi:hypothetical protein
MRPPACSVVESGSHPPSLPRPLHPGGHSPLTFALLAVHTASSGWVLESCNPLIIIAKTRARPTPRRPPSSWPPRRRPSAPPRRPTASRRARSWTRPRSSTASTTAPRKGWSPAPRAAQPSHNAALGQRRASLWRRPPRAYPRRRPPWASPGKGPTQAPARRRPPAAARHSQRPLPRPARAGRQAEASLRRVAPAAAGHGPRTGAWHQV